MPRLIDFGAPYGTREFPDGTADEDIAAEYRRLTERPAAPPPVTPEPGLEDYYNQATRSLIIGAARQLASLPKAAGAIGAATMKGIGYVPGLEAVGRAGDEYLANQRETSDTYRLGQLIESVGEAIAPAAAPELQESFIATKVPEAAGSGLGFLLGGTGVRLLRRGLTSAATRKAEQELLEAAAKKGASLGTKALAAVSEGAEIGTLGAVSQFQSEYEKAINAGADRDTALKAGVLGLPIGATEAIPLSNMLRRLDRFSGGGFTRYLLTAGKEAFEEGLQEAAQNFASNAVEKGLYNEAKSLTDDLIPQAGAGGAAGFLLSTLTQALGARVRRARKGLSADRDGTTTGSTAQTQEVPPVVPGAQAPVQVRGAEGGGVESATRTIEAALRPYGVAPSQRLTIVNDPADAAPAARTIFDENNVFQRIELNQAKLPNAAEIQKKFEHEVSHVASDSGALREVLDVLTPQERGDIALEMTRLGYPEGSQNEFDARGTEALVSAWNNRTWFGRLVGRVTAWANETLGVKLNRRAAEAIAVRATGRSIERLRQLAETTTALSERAEEARIYSDQEIAQLAKDTPPRASPSDTSTDFPRFVVWLESPMQTVHGQTKAELKANLKAANNQRIATEAVASGSQLRLGVIPRWVGDTLRQRLTEADAQGAPFKVDINDEWNRLTPEERQQLLSLGWSVSPDRNNRVLIGHTTDVGPNRLRERVRLANRRVEEAKAEPLPAPIQGVQVAGAAAQLGRVAEEAYSKREAAGTQLERLAYERRQYKAARAELRRLTELATGRLFQEGLSLEDNPAMFPDPDEGVGIVDGGVVVGDEFLNKLLVGGEAPNPENTKAMQGEVYFEKEAHRLKNLRGQIDLLQRAITYYEALGVEEAEIAKIQDRINKLSAQATVLSEAQWNGKTMGERTNEIEAAEAQRPGLIAQRQALGLGPVSEFFGRQVGGYRGFLEKALQGHAISEALKASATNPEELARLTEEAKGWLTLPEDVRQAILSGKDLTDEQRASAFARLGEAFEDFDIQREMMVALRDSRSTEINKGVARLTSAIADTKVKEGMAEVLIADVLAALDGESGGTGTLQSQATAQVLKERVTAIRNFALKLGSNLETNGALFDWLTNPTAPTPVVNAQQAAALGVDVNTLAMILAEVKKSPAFGSAVVTLVNSADKKLANLPIVQLEQIQSLLQQGETEAANAAAQAMIVNAKQRASLAASSQRQNLRELEALDIERQALDEGVAMFNELAASPEYRQLRDAVSNSKWGLTDPMDVANNTSRTLRAFGAKGLPSHPELKLGAGDSPALKAEDNLRIWKWRRAAQEHLDAYDAAAALYESDPQNNPSPSSLGFDLPTIRGLRNAVSRSVAGSALELSVQDPGSRWKVPWLVRVMNKASWFRQHDFVAKMVGGNVGVDLRSRLGDWINHFLIARSVSQKYRDVPALRHAAMKSHPEVQMNQALYREFWNELAHWGRIFGSPLRVGFVLPGSGRAVTAEDLALLKRETEYEEDLRRNVTETTPVLGVRVRKGTRDLVRPGAYVGDLGLPRHLNRKAIAFIARVLSAYGDGGGFDVSTDLGVSSANPVVQFWNQRTKQLTQHVLDSTRQDRAMRLDPMMAQAERTAAADWMVNGVPPIQSVDELVTELVKHFPSAPGLNIREQVVKGLNNELMQYRDAAARIESDKAEKDAARTSKVQISFTADNEFTRPAANLELPSELYDYGALTDTDHILIQSRANHERIVAYATAVQRARAELQQRLEDHRNGEMTEKEAFFGGTVEEAKQVLGLLEKIQNDFENAYKMGSPALTQGGWFREATGLLTSAVLALPTVNLRNMVQGQTEVYAMSRAMGIGGERMMFGQALLQMPKTLIRYALHIGHGLAKRADLGQAFLTGQNYDIFKKLVETIAGILGNRDFRASADRVHELGFDTRDGFLERMRRIWQASAESTQVEELGKTKLLGRQVGKLLGVPHSALRALFDTIGVQESDLTINAALLTYATMLEKRLQEVAINYGAERERQGLMTFDPTNPAWMLKPDEWSAFKGEQANRDSLGLFRLFMEQAASAEGFQLEKNLWEYYQKAKAGPARLFTDRQFDAMQRGLLAQFNASTPANRSSAAAGNNVIRNLLTLQGYVSDGMLKLINVFMGGSRDRTAIATIMAKLPVLGGLALMSVLIGYVVGALTGEWEKRVRGRAPSLPTPLDGDFYTSLKRWGDGTARLSLAQLFYLGDLILAIRGEVSGNRGFDPVGRVFPISIAQRALGALRGMFVTQGSVRDKLTPWADMGRSLVPWVTELENAFGQSVGAIKQGQRIIMGEAQVQDLLPERRAQPFTGPQYGPTTVVRRNLTDAVSRFWEKQQAGDSAGAAQALENAKVELKKLEDYYTAKYVKGGATPEAAVYKARQDLWRDYQELNPAVAGMLGKRPTKAEWDSIRGAITGDRAKAVDAGIAAWQAGARELFGRAAPITREDVAASRGGGGGFRGGLAGVPSMIPRGRRIGVGGIRGVGGVRPVSFRRPRISAGRVPSVRVPGLRRRRIGVGRIRRPRLRRLAGPRIRTPRISPGRRRLGLARRRRRRQAAGV